MWSWACLLWSSGFLFMFWVQVERFSRCSRSNGDGRRGKGENQKLDARSDIRWENTKLLLQTVGPQIHDRASQQSGSLSLQPTVFFAFASKNNADVCLLGCILCMRKRKADAVQCVLFYSIIANETDCICCSQPKAVFILQKKKIIRRANHHVGGDAVHVLDLSVISPEHVWKLYFTERK